MGGKARIGKETLIVDDKKSKSSFSMKGYLLKGLIAFILIGGIFYFSFGKTHFAIGGAKEEKTQPTGPPDIGWVNGILYAEKNPAAVIDKDIMSEGQMIHGVKVVKVHKDKVEFEKQGKRWEQKLKEEPNMYWIDLPQCDKK
jgi:hypothetical protein